MGRMIKVKEIEGGVRVVRSHLTVEHEPIHAYWDFNGEELAELITELNELLVMKLGYKKRTAGLRLVDEPACTPPDPCTEGGI